MIGRQGASAAAGPPLGRVAPPAAASRTAPPRLAAERSLAVLVTLYLLSSLDRQILSLVVLPLQADLHLSDTQLGAISGLAFVAFYVATGVAIGWCVDRWSKRWILFFGVASWSLATIACGLARSFEQLFAARLAVGAGEATLAPAAVAIIGRLFTRDRLGTANGVFYMAPNLGGGLLFACGGLAIGAMTHRGGLDLPVLGHLAPWQSLFVMAGFAGLPLAGLAFAIHEPRDPAPSRDPARPSVDASLKTFAKARWRLWLLHALGFAFVSAPCIATMAWAPAYLGRLYGMSPAQVGLWIAVSSGVFASISQYTWGSVIDRLLKRGHLDAHYKVFLILVLLGVPVTVLVYAGLGPVVSVASLCLLWMVSLGVGPLAAALQLFTPGQLRGRVSAVSSIANAVFGIGLTPFLVGVVTDYAFHSRAMVGWSIILVSGCFSAAGALVLLFARRLLAEVVSLDANAAPEAPP